MVDTWITPAIEELSVACTEHSGSISDNYDGLDWDNKYWGLLDHGNKGSGEYFYDKIIGVS